MKDDIFTNTDSLNVETDSSCADDNRILFNSSISKTNLDRTKYTKNNICIGFKWTTIVGYIAIEIVHIVLIE